MRLSPLLAALCLVACSSSTSKPTGPCAQRDGTYVVDFVERSGNCGPQNESVLVVHESQQVLNPSCKGSVQTSPDNCSTESDYTCPAPTLGAGWATKLTGKIDYAADASRGNGTIEITVYNASGVVVCDGTYDAEFTRQN